MRLNGMTALWARTAMVWFLVTVSIGLFMGISQSFNYAPAHAHMGVLGWLSSAVFALIYGVSRQWPAGARPPRLHWAAHNIGVVVMTGALFLELRSNDGFYGPFIAIGGVVIVVAALWLVAMMWGRVSSGELPAE
jgi:hypothetical protein